MVGGDGVGTTATSWSGGTTRQASGAGLEPRRGAMLVAAREFFLFSKMGITGLDLAVIARASTIDLNPTGLETGGDGLYEQAVI